jgi:LEA14-like dessication related protein
MSNRQRLVFILILILSLNGCATLKEMVQEPTVTFKEVVPQDLSLTEGTFRFNFNVSNPNPLGLTLSKVTYDLQLNQKEFLKNNLEEGIKVPAKGAAVMGIPVTVRYSDLFSSLSEALKSDSVAYNLKGTVGVGRSPFPTSNKGS